LAAGRSRCGPPACNSCRDGGRTGATLKRVALSSFLRSFPKRERTNAANQRTGTADSKHKAPHSDGRAAPSPRILPINWGLLIPVIRLEGGKKSARSSRTARGAPDFFTHDAAPVAWTPVARSAKPESGGRWPAVARRPRSARSDASAPTGAPSPQASGTPPTGTASVPAATSACVGAARSGQVFHPAPALYVYTLV
jgi:hypothetical protein